MKRIYRILFIFGMFMAFSTLSAFDEDDDFDDTIDGGTLDEFVVVGEDGTQIDENDIGAGLIDDPWLIDGDIISDGVDLSDDGWWDPNVSSSSQENESGGFTLNDFTVTASFDNNNYTYNPNDVYYFYINGIKYVLVDGLFIPYEEDEDENNESSNCPNITNITVMDANNTSRRVTGTEPALVMVDNGLPRRATIILHGNFDEAQEGYPTISGENIDQRSKTIAKYEGNSSVLIEVDGGEDCDKYSGTVLIEPEMNIDIDAKINAINTSLKSISNKAKLALSSLSTDIDINVGFMGSGEIKRVDFYNDGSKYGQYVNLSLGAEAKFNLPEINTLPIPVWAGLYVKVPLKPGGFSFSGSVNGVYDESQSSPGDITGAFSVGLVDMSLTGSLGAGDPRLICGEVNATLGLKSLMVEGVLEYKNNSLQVTPTYNLNKLYGEISLTAKINYGNFECTFWSKDHTFCEGLNEKDPPITLFSIN